MAPEQLMDKLITMQAAAELVPSGCMLALGGTTLYRRPLAFARALLQRRLQSAKQTQGRPSMPKSSRRQPILWKE